VPRCTLTLRDNVEVAAAFGFMAPPPSLPTPLLAAADANTVSIHVDVGQGGYLTVTAPPRGGSGIHCQKNCDAGGYRLLDTPTFAAHPASKKWKIKRWHKGCSGTKPSCRLHVDQATSVGVTFKRK
jgi:hypothetical protein